MHPRMHREASISMPERHKLVFPQIGWQSALHTVISSFSGHLIPRFNFRIEVLWFYRMHSLLPTWLRHCLKNCKVSIRLVEHVVILYSPAKISRIATVLIRRLIVMTIESVLTSKYSRHMTFIVHSRCICTLPILKQRNYFLNLHFLHLSKNVLLKNFNHDKNQCLATEIPR